MWVCNGIGLDLRWRLILYIWRILFSHLQCDMGYVHSPRSLHSMGIHSTCGTSDSSAGIVLSCYYWNNVHSVGMHTASQGRTRRAGLDPKENQEIHRVRLPCFRLVTSIITRDKIGNQWLLVKLIVCQILQFSLLVLLTPKLLNRIPTRLRGHHWPSAVSSHTHLRSSI